MALSIGVRRIRRARGKIFVQFTDGTLLEFGSLDELREYADIEDREILRRLALAFLLRRDGNGENVALLEGKTITIDMAADDATKLLQVTG